MFDATQSFHARETNDMKNLVILGAGSGGTMLANRMRKRLPADWQNLGTGVGELVSIVRPKQLTAD